MTPNQYTFRYRVRNWSDYNRALIARGRLTFWFDEDAVAAWRNADPVRSKYSADPQVSIVQQVVTVTANRSQPWLSPNVFPLCA